MYHTYTNPRLHVPKTKTYIAGKETLPTNHEQLFEMSVPVFNKNSKKWERWAREGSGNNARYHRFGQHHENEFHWNGSSSGGVDGRGNPRRLEVPIPRKEIDDLIDPPKTFGWWFW